MPIHLIAGFLAIQRVHIQYRRNYAGCPRPEELIIDKDNWYCWIYATSPFRMKCMHFYSEPNLVSSPLAPASNTWKLLEVLMIAPCHQPCSCCISKIVLELQTESSQKLTIQRNDCSFRINCAATRRRRATNSEFAKVVTEMYNANNCSMLFFLGATVFLDWQLSLHHHDQ